MSGADERLKAIKARAEGATPGPWWTEGVPAIYAKVPKGRPNGEGIMDATYYGRRVPESQANAEFVAHAREDVPYLLALVEHADALAKACIQAYELKPGVRSHGCLLCCAQWGPDTPEWHQDNCPLVRYRAARGGE